MAKTSKKQVPTVNPRSRAAKRATSPSINVDKSIKEAPRALGTDPVLGVTRGSGVTKKKKVKNATRGQRSRQEKGLARAEAVMDQMEKKMDGAKLRLRKRHMRKALWEDVNEASIEEKRKAVRTPGREALTEEGGDHTNEGQKDETEIEMSNTGTNEPPKVGSDIPSSGNLQNQNGLAHVSEPHVDDTDLIT